MNYNLGISQASTVDSFFAATTSSQDQFDSLSKSSLSRGIDSFIAGNYDRAVQEFGKAVAFSPYSDNAADALTYMADAYQKQNKGNEAIKTYQNAIKLFPNRDDFHVKLGDIYMVQGQLGDAEKEYTKAVSISPTTPLNRYSLGQVYLETNRLDAAEQQFNKLIQLSPKDPSGYFGLGEVARGRGALSEAAGHFEKAIATNKDFPDAYLKLGYTYADLGNTDKIQEQVDELQKMNSSLSSDLENYTYKVAKPKLFFAASPAGFDNFSGPGTEVSALSSSLSEADAQQSFVMNFIFNKEMDSLSVENIANWQIGRQAGGGYGTEYNFGMALPSTEVSLPVLPSSVVYDSNNMTAVVTFSISQNETGDGTIDPSHIAFKFSGIDAYGKTMDPTADEYSGFSKIV
ncbi:MAG: hypothetical protein C0402_10005 [Thermodesulfovibrio sp.]|nr:hypothetical protein [Thermodesulfovibrio sp.]